MAERPDRKRWFLPLPWNVKRQRSDVPFKQSFRHSNLDLSPIIAIATTDCGEQNGKAGNVFSRLKRFFKKNEGISNSGDIDVIVEDVHYKASNITKSSTSLPDRGGDEQSLLTPVPGADNTNSNIVINSSDVSELRVTQRTNDESVTLNANTNATNYGSGNSNSNEDDGENISNPPEAGDPENRLNSYSQNMNNNREVVMANEKRLLANCGWYWGPLSRDAAQRKLTGQPNGTFLVRDSQTDTFQFTFSFRSAGCTLHSRIDFINEKWNIESNRFKSVVDLIEDTMRISKSDVFCFVRQSPLQPDFPVRLTTPLSRFKSSSLQHLCRVAMRNQVQNDLTKLAGLSLPPFMKDYLIVKIYEDV